MKKIPLLGVIFLGILLAGCSNESSVKKVTSKSIQASKNIKNASTSLVTLANSAGKKNTTEVNGTFSTSPDALKLAQQSNGKDMGTFYINDKAMYYKNANKWYKQPGSDNAKSMKSAIKQLRGAQATQILKKLQKHLTLKSDGSKYVLSYDGKGKVATSAGRDMLKQEMGSNMSSSAIDQMVSAIKIKHFTYKYVVNKKSYLPVSSQIVLKYVSSGQSGTQKITGKYSKVNKTKKVVVPSKIKSTAHTLKTK